MTFDPTVPLAAGFLAGDLVRVTIPAGGLRNLDGDALGRLFAFSFRTGCNFEDPLPGAPRVVGVEFSPDAEPVASGTSITIRFSEAMDPTTVDPRVVDESGDEVCTELRFADGLDRVTLVPLASFGPEARTMRVTFAGAPTDLAGNPLPGPFERTEHSPLLHQKTQEMPSEAAPLTQAILNRSSTRRFAREPIALTHFRAVLEHATRGVPADFLVPEVSSLVDVYAIVNSVEGLPSGSYFFSSRDNELELLQAGDFREESGHLGFEQALPADASAVLFFMTDLEGVLARLGNRGYRVAQMEAGILGGKMYLGVHSLGFGASGLTFYDDAVSRFFSPHAVGKSTLFVLPLGRRAAINRVRPFRSKVAARLDALARGAGQSRS